MPVLGVSLVVGVVHERIVLEHRLPVGLVLAVCAGFAHKLLDRYLVGIVVLKNQVGEVSSVLVLLELHLNMAAARPGASLVDLAAHRAVCLYDVEAYVLVAQRQEAAESCSQVHFNQNSLKI